jgi:hypothetical protein
LQEQVTALQEESSQLRQSVTQLESKVTRIIQFKQLQFIDIRKCTKLTKENDILKRNISCLFKTAQLEIQRKDEEIARLRASNKS